ncbi:glycoside hydrolase family 43 protein [Bombardia bombarda]|uniref:Glycoside hydrolase family 43 protein n=1 Tax=Bombardia bombarda TaxID=252184 RepID=A0AA39X844_9PEZI|nr:glycoside hydrolase family 43 protein [Bombardia bombarda]
MISTGPTYLTVLSVLLSAWTCLALVIDTPTWSSSHTLGLSEYGNQVTTRADPSLAGYLGVFFLGADPYVYFYLSNGNNPTSFKALNKGSPIMKPTKGTGGVRDPTIIPGGGQDATKKWYIIGTDLNIGKTNWDASQRTGSKGIFVWESTDMINWVNERLVTVEDSTAGMVWAPEAIWDPAKGKFFYLVHWASKFYPTSDSKHTGNPSNIQIRYAYTSDFKTFSPPKTFINKSPTNIIDLTILALNGTDGQSFLRFMKDETKKTVFVEVSTTGLFGTWTRPGGDAAVIQSSVEGPAAYLDNQVAGKVHLLLDFYGADGYRPYESADPGSNSGWAASSRTGFPANLRHGSVLPVNQAVYAALNARWG